MSKTVHIIGAGGPAGIGFTECLYQGPMLDSYTVQGHDGSPWGEAAMVCNPEDVPMMNCDMVVPIPDAAVAKYADCDLCFLPSKEEIELCQDKAALARKLGYLAPKLYWVRDTHGAGGKGAQMMSEYLPGRNVSVELVYWQGILKASFAKERLSYAVSRVEHSVIGVGSSAVSKCIKNHGGQGYMEKAIEAVMKISNNAPHGIYGVDLRQNDEKNPKWRVTEINPGRFMTASYAFFREGYNLPQLCVELFLGLPVTKLGDYPLDLTCIRQVGSRPVLTMDENIIYPEGWLQ